jgi:hypothetical protein
MLACDFPTVETVWLTRIYVLFFVSLERRRIEFVTSTTNPDGRWVAQQARNLLMLLADREQSFRFLLHDRDSKFSRAFDQVFRSEDMKIIRTPIRAPNANAYAERWVGTLRRECLDRILIINRRHLEHVVRLYTAHYNRHRPHRALHLLPPNGRDPTQPRAAPAAVQRRDLSADSSMNTRPPEFANSEDLLTGAGRDLTCLRTDRVVSLEGRVGSDGRPFPAVLGGRSGRS